MKRRCPSLLQWLLLLQACVVRAIYAENSTLHDYCIKQLPLFDTQTRGQFSLVNLIRMCGNLHLYADCILTERNALLKDIKFQTELYEKYFPSEEDLYRALYGYCGEYLVSYSERLPFEYDVTLSQCEHTHSDMIAACHPHITQQDKLAQLRRVVDNRELSEIMRLSCRQCLQSMNSFSPILMYQRCVTSSAVTLQASGLVDILQSIAVLAWSCFVSGKLL
ncbi:uncharacterized protein LOC106058171 isoform X2 [Biomphalaria glabrata]|uniref:Uncharacterized protein LOC106058171 isoform X2 n=1 Tax=Biomphalaria glabrata TaxID=6526 RepID=A0A9W2YM68_BIOGL|nr:uncharacterized protein LOC106058171 isoform X2 [Biomphalaria glabrata]